MVPGTSGNAGLLRIGVFSTLSGISVRMLRHYQERGLLAPGWVEPESGYRFYRAEQLRTAQLLVSLRDAGFSIERMGQVLAAIDRPATVRSLIETQRVELQHQVADVNAQLIALSTIYTQLEEPTMSITVTTSTLPALHQAVLRRRLSHYGAEGELWTEIMPLLQQSGATFPAGGISGATFFDAEYRDADVDVAVWIEVAAAFEATEPLVCESLPSREVVTARLEGDYSAMPQVMHAIGEYIAAEGLVTGPMFNIYHVSPAQNPDPAAWITDVCVPIKRP